MQLSNPAVEDVYGLEAAAIAAGVLDVHTAKRFRSSLEMRTVFIEMHFGESYGSQCFMNGIDLGAGIDGDNMF